jgi:hypothetical protein
MTISAAEQYGEQVSRGSLEASKEGKAIYRALRAFGPTVTCTGFMLGPGLAVVFFYQSHAQARPSACEAR